MDTGFRTRSCSTKNLERYDDSKKSHLALGALDAVAETSEQFAKFQAGEVARSAALLKSVDFVPN